MKHYGRFSNILISLIFLSFSAFADPEFGGSPFWYKTGQLTLLEVSSDSPETEPGTKDNPIVLYVPMQNDAGAAADDDEAYSRVDSTVTANAALPDLDVAVGSNDGLLVFTIVNNEATTNEFFIGMKNSSSSDSYRVMALTQGTIPTDVGNHNLATVSIGTNSSLSVSMSAGAIMGSGVNDACKGSLTAATECTIVVSKNANGGAVVIGDTITETDARFDADTALYFTLNARVYAGSVTEPPTIELERGDESVFVTWTTGDLSTNFATTNVRKVNMVYIEAASGNITPANDQWAQAVILADVRTEAITENIEDESSGTFTLRGLENGVTYNITLCIEDDWGYCSTFPEQIEITPAALETFLDEQSCYFASAGFKEEHFVLDFLKEFRDETLKSFWLGEKFVNFYYSSAPKYAIHIAKSEILSALTRGVAWFSYGLIKYFYYILAGLMFLMGGRLVMRRYF